MQVYGSCLFAAITLCGAVLLIQAPARQRPLVPLWTALSAFFGIVFSRLVYWLVNASFYLVQVKDWTSLFRLSEGGLSMTGALLGAVLATVVFGRVFAERDSLPDLLNQLSFVLPLFIALERMTEWLVLGMGFGAYVSEASIFTVPLQLGPALNVALYETAVAMALMLLLRKGQNRFLRFLFFYGITQVLMESLRADAHMMWGFVRAQQLFAFLMAVLSGGCFAWRGKRLLPWLAQSVLSAALIVFLEFALDGRVLVPIESLKTNADAFWYALYAGALAQYAFAGIRLMRRILPNT